MVVKSKVTTGDITSEFAYKLLDESPEFTTDTFKLELPENVEMISMEDFGPKAVTVEEAEAALGHSFLRLLPNVSIKYLWKCLKVAESWSEPK